MSIQKKVNSVLSRQLKTLGGEIVIIEGQEVLAIPAEVDTNSGLMGGSREQRDIDYQFPTQRKIKVKKGMGVEAAGKKWKIDNFQRGTAMTTIRLIEPNRMEE